MYATTRYNFVRLKATHKISPLEELVGGRSPPSSSQRLTGMIKIEHIFVFILTKANVLVAIIFAIMDSMLSINIVSTHPQI
jgi:hypothetical protein